MEFEIFGHVLEFSLGRRKKKQTETTIIQLPNTTPRDSMKKLGEHALRQFARKAVPRRAISLIRDGVLAQQWRIVPVKDGAKLPMHAVKAVKNIIEHPNPIDDYRAFWGQIINESLIGDNGAAEIVFDGSIDKPLNLYPVNGFSLEHVKGFFTEKNYPRFCQVLGADRTYLMNEDIFYLQRSKFVDSPFGLSPLESAFRELEALFDAQAYAGRNASNAIPKTALNLGEDVSKEDLISFRKYFVEEVYGSGQTAIIGGTKGSSAIQIGATGDAELFLEWQNHLISLVALAFSIDPKKLAQGSNIDRSTVEEQNETTLNEAIRPYCLLIQDEINRKIIGRLGLKDILRFEFFFEDSLDQKTKKQTMLTEQWVNAGITLNEYRDALGLKPIDGEYGDMTQAEMKAKLNQKYAIQTNGGGYNGLGKNRKENVSKKIDKT